MSQFIDRRLHTRKKSAVNRQRFLQRYKKQIKRAVSDAIGKRGITEIEQGEIVSIPTKDILEPRFHKGKGGVVESILPGNDRYMEGDSIQRPSQEAGTGNNASDTGEGEDNFIFQISREEFLEIYFEDLELPDLIKKELAHIELWKSVRKGFTTAGTPTNINVLRSMRQASARRIALLSTINKEIAALQATLQSAEQSLSPSESEIQALKEKISVLQKRKIAVPFLDTLDLRYNNKIRIPAPTTKAVMFCIMDVSGSMDESKKDIAKRFFILLYLFLTRNYQKIELVFLRHHTSAKEVTEEEFFYSRETGGTVVSSALELLLSIIQERFSSTSWNIYAAQASDGDNWNADSPFCKELLQEKIMPLLQYFAYVEIMPRQHQSLWEAYQQVAESHTNFSMKDIDTIADIYPVFRTLFKRKAV